MCQTAAGDAARALPADASSNSADEATADSRTTRHRGTSGEGGMVAITLLRCRSACVAGDGRAARILSDDGHPPGAERREPASARLRDRDRRRRECLARRAGSGAARPGDLPVRDRRAVRVGIHAGRPERPADRRDVRWSTRGCDGNPRRRAQHPRSPRGPGDHGPRGRPRPGRARCRLARCAAAGSGAVLVLGLRRTRRQRALGPAHQRTPRRDRGDGRGRRGHLGRSLVPGREPGHDPGGAAGRRADDRRRGNAGPGAAWEPVRRATGDRRRRSGRAAGHPERERPPGAAAGRARRDSV